MNQDINPVIVGLHLCERVLMDAATKQISLIQLIQNVNAPKFPTRAARWFLYGEFTGCHGAASLTFRVVDALEEREPVCQLSLQLQQDDPLAVGHIICHLPPLVFPDEGEYRIQAIPGDGVPFEKRLVVRKIIPPSESVE